jgi:DMSO/TMAO reductase YedYZ molybdopterin-dependent catalytic subunit/mono/diheme cytochrome c family protein
MPTSLGRRAFVRRVIATVGSLGAGASGCGEARERPRRSGPAREYDQDGGPAATTPVGPGALPDGLAAADFEIFTRTPLTLQTRRSRLPADALTPTTRLFVRNNLPLPATSIVEHAHRWRLQVRGVMRPRTLSLADLRALGERTVTAVLQCSGNGRRFFAHDPSGSPWTVGGAGCVRWTGVPVGDVIASLGGPRPGARFVTTTGGDPLPKLPESIEPSMLLVERSIPLDKGMSDALLAWELNGEPIPLTHGGPLRLVVPGYYGVNNVKYASKLTCSDRESDARIQEHSYRMRPIGDKSDEPYPTMWRMPVKSWIVGPGADAQPVVAGKVRIEGVAFSGERGVRSVEVSVDGGASWTSAALLGPDLGVDAWRPFALETRLGVGTHRLISRATDAAGDVQPELRLENAQGYGHNGWRDHGLDIEVFATMPERPPAPPPEEETVRAPAVLSDAAKRGRDVFLQQARPSCANCHALEDAEAGMSIGPDLDQLAASAERIASAVRSGLGPMPAYGDQLTAEQLDELVRYVTEARRG